MYVCFEDLLTIGKIILYCFFDSNSCICLNRFLMLFNRYLCAMNLTDMIKGKCDYLFLELKKIQSVVKCII